MHALLSHFSPPFVNFFFPFWLFFPPLLWFHSRSRRERGECWRCGPRKVTERRERERRTYRRRRTRGTLIDDRNTKLEQGQQHRGGNYKGWMSLGLEGGDPLVMCVWWLVMDGWGDGQNGRRSKEAKDRERNKGRSIKKRDREESGKWQIWRAGKRGDNHWGYVHVWIEQIWEWMMNTHIVPDRVVVIRNSFHFDIVENEIWKHAMAPNTDPTWPLSFSGPILPSLSVPNSLSVGMPQTRQRHPQTREASDAQTTGEGTTTRH